MRKIFYSLMALTLGATLASCAKNEPAGEGETKSVKLTVGAVIDNAATTPESRLGLGGNHAENQYTMLWHETDQIAVRSTYKGSVVGTPSKFTMSNLGVDNLADFTGLVNMGAQTGAEGAHTHTLYAWAPFDAATESSGVRTVKIKSTQYPSITVTNTETESGTVTSVSSAMDASAVYMVSLPMDIDLHSNSQTQVSTMPFRFTHATGYLRLGLGTMPTIAEDWDPATALVESVTITGGATEFLSGVRTHNLDNTTGEYSWGDWDAGQSLNTITLNYSGVTMQQLIAGNIWVSMLPGTYDDLTIKITTNQQTFTYTGRTGLEVKPNTVSGKVLNFDAAKDSYMKTPPKPVTLIVSGGTMEAPTTSGTKEIDGITFEVSSLYNGGNVTGIAAEYKRFAMTSSSSLFNTTPAGTRINTISLYSTNLASLNQFKLWVSAEADVFDVDIEEYATSNGLGNPTGGMGAKIYTIPESTDLKNTDFRYIELTAPAAGMFTPTQICMVIEYLK